MKIDKLLPTILPLGIVVALVILVKPFKRAFTSVADSVSNLLGGSDESVIQSAKDLESKGVEITPVARDIADNLQDALNSTFFTYSDKKVASALGAVCIVDYVSGNPVFSKIDYRLAAAVYAAFGKRKFWIAFPLEGSNTLTVWLNKELSGLYRSGIVSIFNDALKKYSV